MTGHRLCIDQFHHSGRAARTRPSKERIHDRSPLSRRTLPRQRRRQSVRALAACRAAGAAPPSITVGMIYVGPRDDYGWNQAHAVGGQGAEGRARRQGGRGRERARDRGRGARRMESMINLDGASLLFPTSFGYFDPFMIEMRQEVPRRSSSATRPRCGRPTSIPTNLRRLLLLPRPGALRERHRRGPVDQVQQDRLHRRQADRAGAAQRQRLHARREQGQPERRRCS